MTRVQHIASLVLVTLGITLAVPAEAMTPLARTVRNIDKREARHYKALLAQVETLAGQIDALTTLYLNGLHQTIESQPLTGTSNSGGRTFYVGTVGCQAGAVLTGGGSDWGSAPRGDWVVNYSRPGSVPNTWEVSMFSGDQSPQTLPHVYAVCIKP